VRILPPLDAGGPPRRPEPSPNAYGLIAALTIADGRYQVDERMPRPRHLGRRGNGDVIGTRQIRRAQARKAGRR